jgi:SAM-dependent MidA family methyltransferase
MLNRIGAMVTVPDSAAGSDSLSTRLALAVRDEIAARGGWLPFDRFMALALYAPGLGYYARAGQIFGAMPGDGSDFITAPELSPLFGRALAAQVRQALEATATDEVFEFGAGSGALAEQLLGTLGDRVRRYSIIELSGQLGACQRQRLAPFGERVRWLENWPQAIEGVVVGNEVLDAMPVQLLAFDGSAWRERGVAWEQGGFVWRDVPTSLEPPLDPGFDAGGVTELHAQAEAFITSLVERMARGLAIFIDYGFPQAEYYHPQRCGGTLMCHRAHRADEDPLRDVGAKDITAHVDFTAVALAAQQAGASVVGYTSQGRFLINCGLGSWLEKANLRERVAAHKLIAEHEMGELFKVLAFGRGFDVGPIGFMVGDRTHTL